MELSPIYFRKVVSLLVSLIKVTKIHIILGSKTKTNNNKNLLPYFTLLNTILDAILKAPEAWNILPEIILFSGITMIWVLDHLLDSQHKLFYKQHEINI